MRDKVVELRSSFPWPHGSDAMARATGLGIFVACAALLRWVPRAFVGSSAPVLRSRTCQAAIALWAAHDQVKEGDRLIGWIKHPVLTSGNNYTLRAEVTGVKQGSWSVRKPKLPLDAEAIAEGNFKVMPGESSDTVIMRDETTVLTGKYSSAGTLGGRVSQCGLQWGGFFEVWNAASDDEWEATGFTE